MQQFIEGKRWLRVHVDSLESLGSADLSALTVPAAAWSVTPRVRPGEHDSSRWTEQDPSRFISKASPSYPAAPKLRGVEGTVVLDGLINKEGHVTWLRVLAGPEQLRQGSLDAVRQWVYKPYVLDGQPAEVETEINVVFDLGNR